MNDKYKKGSPGGKPWFGVAVVAGIIYAAVHFWPHTEPSSPESHPIATSIPHQELADTAEQDFVIEAFTSQLAAQRAPGEDCVVTEPKTLKNHRIRVTQVMHDDAFAIVDDLNAAAQVLEIYCRESD
jgi:hypothetical protein